MSEQPTRYCVQCRQPARLDARHCPHCGARLVDLAPETLLGHAGRYRIDRLLGGGGFGIAYLAYDQLLRRACVVKQLIVPDSVDDPDELRQIAASLEREALILASLNSPGHPNIPEIYEYLPERRCLVMKFIAGQSLLQLLAQRAAPLPAETALRYGHDLASALEYIHGRSDAQGRAAPVLHRDIKPANVQLDATGRVWLLDFGLAKAIQPVRGEFASAPQAGGTPGYTPPEQWLGQAEPGSDVYALAATIHTLLTGYRPSKTDLAALWRGEGGALPPIRQFNPEVGPEVEQLIAQGLARDVASRPSAAGFRAGLAAILAHMAIPNASVPDQPPEVPLFVGRADDLARAAERLARQHIVALVGLAGVGKTGLAVTLARQVGDPARTFWHSFHPDEQVDHGVRKLAGFLARQGQPELLRVLQQAGQGAPALSAEQIVDYLIDQLSGRGYLLCLDDAQLMEGADERARQFQQLARRLRAAAQGGALDLIVTARRTPAWVQSGDSLALGGVGADGTRQLLAKRGIQIAATLGDQLYARTEGNAKLLHLACDLLGQAGDPAALIAGLEQSDDIASYLVREVDRGLSDAERAVLGAVAALLGYGGTREAIEELLDADDLRAPLASLRERYLLVVTPSALGPQYGEHAIVRSFYYQGLGRRQRRRLHQRAGAYYARIEIDPLRAIRHFLAADEVSQAAHLATANVQAIINSGEARSLNPLLAQIRPAQLAPDDWAAVCTVAGEVSALLGDYDTARMQLEQALVAGASLEADSSQIAAQARRRRLLALVGERTGNYDQAEADCRNGLTLALSLSQPNVETAALYAQLGNILMRRGDFAASDLACRAGLAVLPPEPGAPGERARLLQRLGTLDGQRGRYAEAVRQLEQSLGWAAQAGDQVLSAAIMNNLGIYLCRIGRLNTALTHHQQSLAIKELLGDVLGKVSSLINIAVIHQTRGDEARQDYARALEQLEAARLLCERHRLPYSLEQVLIVQGMVRYAQGAQAGAGPDHLAQADALLRQALTIAESLDDDFGRVDCLYRLGDVALAQGDPAGAGTFGEQALALARQLDSPDYRSCALRVIGEARLAQGHLPAAAAVLAESWQIQGQVQGAYDQTLVLAALARLRRAEGQPDAALAYLHEGLAIAQAHQLGYQSHLLMQLIGG